MSRARSSATLLQQGADALLRAAGLSEGSVAERLRALAADPRYLYSDDNAGRDQAVADMAARIGLMRQLAAPAFGEALVQDLAANVRRLTSEEEARGAAGRSWTHASRWRSARPGAAGRATGTSRPRWW